MIASDCKKIVLNNRQRGFVLIIVLLLIIMISGLGMLAVRHSRQEARSTGAYVDSTQAVALVESGMAVAITDLRTSPDYYRQTFSNSGVAVQTNPSVTDMFHMEFAIKLSNTFFVGSDQSDCDAAYDVPGCIGDLTRTVSGDNASYRTLITYNLPMVGPCPPGYSCFDDQNYGWYVFGINVNAQFGTEPTFWSRRFVETANATGAGRVTIGPIGAYGN